jgi:Phage tail protein
MTNFLPLNDQIIGYSPVPLSVSQDPVAFDGYWLQNSSVRTTLIDSDDLGKIDLSIFDLPRDDGGWVLSKYYRGRQMRLKVSVTMDTPENLNMKIDEMKRELSKTEGNLDITVNGEIRRIRATITAIKFDRKYYNLTFVQGDITLVTAEPFFRAVNDQSWLFEWRGTDFWEEISHGWSADADPRFYYLFGSGTSASGLSLTCRNRTIAIFRTLSPGDILVIDCDGKQVLHNGVSIDYSGMFPVFSPGSNPFHTVISGTTLADLTVIVAKNYL